MIEKEDKWYEYGETETEFPEVWSSWECGNFYDAEYVQDWFKRCLEDFPYPSISRYPTPEKVADELLGYAVTVKNWHTRWFSQFRNNKDLESEASKNE